MFKGKIQFISGVFVGALIFGGGAALAANTAQIGVSIQSLKYYFDGVEKKPSAGQEGFIYKGTTYVPLRFMGESLSKEVGWDGKTSSIYVGKQPTGQVTYLDSVAPSVVNHFGSDDSWKKMFSTVTSFKTNNDEVFLHGFELASYGYPNGYFHENEYILNGQFSKFEAFIAPSIKWKSQKSEPYIGAVQIFGDDKLIYESGTVASDITKSIPVEIDVTGVLNLKIHVTAGKGAMGILDAKLIR